MKIRRLIAGIFDRLIVLGLFIAIIHIKYGMFITYTIAGTYQGGCVLGRPSNYQYINTLQESVYEQKTSNTEVSPYFKAQQALWCSNHDDMTINDIDFDLTSLFIIANMLYFTTCFVLLKKSIFEMICGINFVQNNNLPANRLYLLYRALIYLVIILFFIGLRFLFNSTYLNMSIIFLLINWLLIILTDKSLFDIFSFTKMTNSKWFNGNISK